MACSTSAQSAQRLPVSARERRACHHGAIRCREAAYVGWKTNSQRGWAREKRKTAVARWVLRLSRMAYTGPASAASHASTRSRKSPQFAVVRRL